MAGQVLGNSGASAINPFAGLASGLASAVPEAFAGTSPDQWATMNKGDDTLAPIPGDVQTPAPTQPVVQTTPSSSIPDSYYASIRSAESGGNDNAKNPTSSATGRYQFLGGTWGQVANAHPELGLTPDGRRDPAQQERAIRAFTEDNAKVLSGAGVPISNGSLYAAHFLGAGGAKEVYRNSDNAAMSDVVGPGVISANGFLRGMSVGEFKQWAEHKGSSRSGPDYGPTSDAMSRPSGSQWSPAGTAGPGNAGGTPDLWGNDTNTATAANAKPHQKNPSGTMEPEQFPGGPEGKTPHDFSFQQYMVNKTTSHLHDLSPSATIDVVKAIGAAIRGGMPKGQL